jgi:hypothetical protein
MAFTHFSRVSSNNIVTYTTQIDNNLILDENGEVSIDLGIKHLYDTMPESVGDRWFVSDLNSPRGFGNIGYLYLEEYDKFIAQKPHSSWILNTDDPNYFYWQCPIPYPSDGKTAANPDGIEYTWVEKVDFENGTSFCNWVAVN